MSWRSVFISQPARLKRKNKQLQIEQEGEIVCVPLEDIGAIVVENQQVNMTTSLLASFAQTHIAVFVCDSKHMPCGVMQPFQQHSRQKKILASQLSASRPFLKKCWQIIVRQKILNQAECLRLCGKDSYSVVKVLADEVLSGDTTGRESYAARLYFASLFPNFLRREERAQTAALDYGYAILRGVIARCLSSYGLLPALGVHHESELNSFNLADDLIEPFRPVVDLWVATNYLEAEEFTGQMRQDLVSLLHYDIKIEGKRQTVLRAIDIAASQFAAAYLEKQPAKLVLPELIDLNEHSYE